jgi:uncharacterized protein (TIGR02646 family)
MRKLDRSAVPAPACLANYQHDTHTWDDVSGEDKQQIRAQLEQIQGRRCAYCEGSLDALGHHIEHFRRKNPLHFPHLKFTWSNLFLACDEHEHCGHYKDRHGADPYNPAELIKPDEHDPDQYLYFHSSGEVRPRSKIAPEAQRPATETIRVFNLDCGSLRAARRRALAQYERKDPTILDGLMELDEESREVFIAEEVQATAGEPHCTVIRHYFEKAR